MSIRFNDNSQLRELALGYLAGGISLVPCGADTKQPDFALLPEDPVTHGPKWKPFQECPPSKNEVERWFRQGCQSVAAIGGKVSGGLLIIDFDEARFYDAWKGLVGSLADGLPVQRTGREGGGYQVYLRCDNPGSSEKLAHIPDDTQKDGRKAAIETKAEGGYAVMPGSLHPTGRRYQVISGDFAFVPKVPQAQADALISAAKKLDEMPLTKQQMELQAKAAPVSEKHRSESNGEASVIDTYNAHVTIHSALTKAGYKKSGERYIRPNGKTPSVGIIDNQRSYHWSANDALCDNHSHYAFDVFCKYSHNGDCKEAVKAAAALLGMSYEKSNKQNKTTASPAEDSTPLELKTRCYDSIVAVDINWFWQKRFAYGKLSLVAGVPGVGKTFLACDMVSRASTGGKFPDGTDAPYCESLIVTAEDAPEDTLLQRLKINGCDLSRVHHLDGVAIGKTERFFSLDQHIEVLDNWFENHPNVGAVVLDPITAFMGDKCDSHKNADVRRVLGPLSTLAARRGVAIIGVTHLSKGQAKAINRVIGSIAFVGAARAAWLVDWDPNQDGRRLFLPIKNNLAKCDGLAYSLSDEGKVIWEQGTVTVTADELSDTEYTAPREEAIDWLRDVLKDGPVSSGQLIKQADREGISKRTLNRVKKDLHIASEKTPSGWSWLLPEHKPDLSKVTPK